MTALVTRKTQEQVLIWGGGDGLRYAVVARGTVLQGVALLELLLSCVYEMQRRSESLPLAFS